MIPDLLCLSMDVCTYVRPYGTSLSSTALDCYVRSLARSLAPLSPRHGENRATLASKRGRDEAQRCYRAPPSERHRIVTPLQQTPVWLQPWGDNRETMYEYGIRWSDREDDLSDLPILPCRPAGVRH